MRRSAALICAALELCCVSCSDDDPSSLERKRLATLTEADIHALCELRQDEDRQQRHALMTVACTDRGRFADACEATRAECIAALPDIDFDWCASPEAEMRARSLYLMELALDPELADVAAMVLDTSTYLPLGADCPVTVRQYLDCFESQTAPLLRAAAEYTCEAGEEARYYPVPKECSEYANAALACVEMKAP